MISLYSYLISNWQLKTEVYCELLGSEYKVLILKYFVLKSHILQNS